MSNEEHLIENAIVCLINNQNFNIFKESKINIEMIEISFKNCNQGDILNKIWNMANHVCYSWFYNETFKEQFEKEYPEFVW